MGDTVTCEATALAPLIVMTTPLVKRGSASWLEIADLRSRKSEWQRQVLRPTQLAWPPLSPFVRFKLLSVGYGEGDETPPPPCLLSPPKRKTNATRHAVSQSEVLFHSILFLATAGSVRPSLVPRRRCQEE